MKRLYPIIAGVALLLIVVWVFMPSAIQVEMATIERGPFEQRIIEDGKTKAKDIYEIVTPVRATMLRVPFKAGARVTKDQLLITMVPTTAELLDVRAEQVLMMRLEAAKAELKNKEVLAERARLDHQTKVSDLKRNQKLAEKGFVSDSFLEHQQSDVDLAKKNHESAIYNVEVGKHELERAKTAIKRYKSAVEPQLKAGNVLEITSPVDGQIVRVKRESRGTVDAGTVIMEVADVRNLEVIVDLLSSDAVKVPENATVWVTRWGGDKPLKAKVRLIEPGGYTKISSLGVEEQRVDVLIDFESPYDDWQSLGVGFQVDAEIVIYAADSALQVPVSALFRHGKDWAVFVVERGRAVLKNIEISWRNPHFAVVEKGLSIGEKVILYPGDRVEDGARVKK